MKIEGIAQWMPGLKRPLLISGPCSAETEGQLLATCRQLAASGKVDILRAGIWKPRTRPNNFEGVGTVGLRWLQQAKAETGLKTAVEVANIRHVYGALKHGVDILWIGARTAANPFSVQEIADTLTGVDVTVLVKNPVNADLDLWIGAIERIHKAGITKIGAIHRGFSKYGESNLRNIPQWQIPIELKRRIPNLPLICDPSHICGNRELLAEISQEALDLNYDGLMIESHIDPDNALSDAKQQITPSELSTLMDSLKLRNEQAKRNGNASPSPIDAFRQQIDQIDGEIMTLLSSRMKVADTIGQFKKENDITILQHSRWNEIVEGAIKKAGKLGLSPTFIAKYLKAVHQESINHQNLRMKEF